MGKNQKYLSFILAAILLILIVMSGRNFADIEAGNSLLNSGGLLKENFQIQNQISSKNNSTFCFQKEKCEIINNQETIALQQSNDPALVAASESTMPPSEIKRLWENLEPQISAESAIAISEPGSESGASAARENANFILYSKNIFEKRPIASLTKLMTSLVAVSYLDLGQKVTINTDFSSLPSDGMSCNLLAKEQFTVEQLLYCLLVISANDAALTLSETMPAFVALMNVKAKALGLRNTYFEEPAGLSPLNQSSAYDVAKLAQFIFREHFIIFKIQKTPQIIITSLSGNARQLINFNRFVSRTDYKGGKTGFTDEALGTLVSIFELQNSKKPQIIIVVLGSRDRFGDTLEILDWVKKEYRFD